MIGYHFVWNLVYLYDVKWNWYESVGAYVWQQSICWTFIFLSGFCWSFGKRHFSRGMLVFGGGILVSLVTLLVMPENRIVFGVLTLLGSCMLLQIPLEKVERRIKPELGAVGSAILFVLTRNINDGHLGFEKWNLISLPKEWYQGYAATFLGLTSYDFYSTDYFSLFPWIFLFGAGYFTYRICEKYNVFKCSIFQWRLLPFSALGRNSLIIYLLHQPVLYALCMIGHAMVNV